MSSVLVSYLNHYTVKSDTETVKLQELRILQLFNNFDLIGKKNISWKYFSP